MIYILNTKGKSSSDVINFFDFDFKTSLVDSVNGSMATLKNSVTQSSEGLHFPSTNTGRVTFSGDFINHIYYVPNTRIEIKFGDVDMSTLTRNARFFMWSSDSGIIYHNDTQKWSIYNYNRWYDSDISDKNFFDNSTLRIDCLSDKWDFYKNDVLFFSINNFIPLQPQYITLGSTSNSIINTIIESMKISYIGGN